MQAAQQAIKRLPAGFCNLVLETRFAVKFSGDIMKPDLTSLFETARAMLPGTPANRGRRGALQAAATVALAAVLAFPAAPTMAQGQDPRDWNAEHWVGTWGAAPAGPPLEANTQVFTNQTLRLIVHTSIGGNRVRVRVSNEFGTTALRIGGAHVALRQAGSEIVAGTDRVLTFSLSWPFLTEVDVTSSGAAIVTLGNSITDGTRSTPDTNNRWPDWLARRLQITRDNAGINTRLGVVNRGISGNRLLTNPAVGSLSGRNALERFDRDVLATAGVRYMTVMIGINDIGNSTPEAPVTADDLISGYRQLIARAHVKGIAVFGATLTPFQGAGYYSPEKDVVRQAVNNWIRNSDEFDGVIDFDRVTRDPSNPLRLLPAYDSGDHLHPNDLGYQAMGSAVPLELFRAIGSSNLRRPAKAQAATAH
jgi:lysophospholipase L1-like esterase